MRIFVLFTFLFVFPIIASANVFSPGLPTGGKVLLAPAGAAVCPFSVTDPASPFTMAPSGIFPPALYVTTPGRVVNQAAPSTWFLGLYLKGAMEPCVFNGATVPALKLITSGFSLPSAF